MRVVILSDEMKTFRFNTDCLTFGRAEDNLLQLDIAGVSRYHGKIEKRNGNYVIYDLGSTNGIYINGEKISNASVLREGDIVRLNDVKLQFFELQNDVKSTGIVFSEVDEDTEQLVVSVDDINGIEPSTKTTFLSDLDVDNEVEKKSDLDVKDIADYLQNNRIFQKNKDVVLSKEKSKKTTVQKKEKSNKKEKSTGWIFYVIVVCVVISLVSLFVIFVVKNEEKNVNSSANSVAEVADKMPDLYIDYVKEIITEDNIYRFALTIAKDKAMLSVDDVKSQLSVGPLPLQLTDIDLARLRQAVVDSNFLAISENNYEKLENGKDRDYRSLMVIYNNKQKSLKVVNSESPIEFMDIEDSLDLYVQSCDLPFLTLSTEDLMKSAIESFRVAEDLFANYEANYANLKKAIYEYNLVKEYLRGFSPEPRERKMAMKRLEQAEAIRKERFKVLRAEYDSFIHKKDLTGARNVVALILDLYGEDTKEYEYFRDRLIKIDEILRKNNRRKK